MKRMFLISLFFLVINYLSADNSNLINDFEKEIDIFESAYKSYYLGESFLLQWQLYAKNAFNIYINISNILNNKENTFSNSEIERITQLINKFKIAFLINESINRHEILLNNFETAINRYTENKTNENLQVLNNILQQLIQDDFYIKIHQVVGVFPFNNEQLNKLEILVERNRRLTARLRDVMQKINICDASQA